MNYLFYDYETSGLCERFDQVFQFAAIRTDENFEPVGEPIEAFCKLRTDILPSPAAIQTNEINIDELNEKGLFEFEFAKIVHDTLVGKGDQIICGYNSKEFDNNFTRFLLYRNFLNPYAWSWINRNSCLDIIDVVRLGYSFGRFSNIRFEAPPNHSFKLQELTRINKIEHGDAHNALSDAIATLNLAKSIYEDCPRVFSYCLGLRNFDGASSVVRANQVFFNCSVFYGRESGYLGLLFPICHHPVFGNRSVIAWRLASDPAEVLDKSPDEIREQMFTASDSREFSVGFEEIKLNKSPMIGKVFEKEKERFPRYDDCMTNLNHVRANQVRLAALAREVFNTVIPEVDPDADLYAGDFFGEEEQEMGLIQRVRSNPMEVSHSEFTSRRFRRLLVRLKARNFHDNVPPKYQEGYRNYVKEKFAYGGTDKWRTRSVFDAEFKQVMNDPNLTKQQRECLLTLHNRVSKIHYSALSESVGTAP